MNLTAWYEVRNGRTREEFLTIEGQLTLELIRKHFYRPHAPDRFIAVDSDPVPYTRPYVSILVNSRSEFLDLFEVYKKNGLKSGDFNLSLPSLPIYSSKQVVKI